MTFPHTDVEVVTPYWGDDVGGGSGQSCLFCLTVSVCCLESDCREKDACTGRAPGLFRRPDRLRRPLKNHLLGIVFLCVYPRRGVPITASGPQGEQPLSNMNNAGKGSRQIRPVTLGKGLALVLRGSGCCVVAVCGGLIVAVMADLSNVAAAV